MKKHACSITAVLVLFLLAFFARPALAVDMSAVIAEKVTPTYAVAGVANTPAATPTDVITLYGASSKYVRIRKILVSGMATTAGSMDVSIVKRNAANTGGTSSAPAITRLNSANAAASAAAALYTANPSSTGAGGAIATKKLNFGLAGTAGTIEFSWPSGDGVAPILRSATEGIAINLNGQAVPAGGTFSYTIVWEEF